MTKHQYQRSVRLPPAKKLFGKGDVPQHLNNGKECYKQLVELKEGSYPNESSNFTACDLRAGCCFDPSLLR
jgi:hypothetical protein